MKFENQFQFVKSQHLDQVTALQATMHDFSYGKHAHEEYSFGVTQAGRQDFFSNGEFHKSRPGNIIIFNPGQFHDGQSGDDNALQYRMIYIHPHQLEPMLGSAGVKQCQDYQIKDTLLDDPQLRHYILNIAAHIENNANDKLQLENLLYQMAERIARRHGDLLPTRKTNKNDTLLLKAQNYIHENIGTDITLDEISSQVSLSKYHFIRMFRQQFGITPHQYILNCRINRVRQALEAGSVLEDIVFDFGFSDLSHLNRRFKPVFGMTPRQYQKHFLIS